MTLHQEWAEERAAAHAGARRATLSGRPQVFKVCLLYTSDAADERSSVDLGGRRIIKKTTVQDLNRMPVVVTQRLTRR